MSTERRQVLEMLAQGKIAAEDAERLLDKLAASRERPDDFSSAEEGSHRSGHLKYLRVLVDSKGGDTVNIRVPIALVRTGIKLSAMMPAGASEKLSQRGIDLSQLSALKGAELMEALRELKVDVDSVDGDKVRIFCE